MENYFVLLELPVKSYERHETRPDNNFWNKTRQDVMNGSAKVISSRVDTGVCEELRSYLKQINHFTTFVLLQTMLNPADLLSQSSLYSSLASSIKLDGKTQVLDKTADFQVLVQA